jgi:cytochrome c oxidase subunit III
MATSSSSMAVKKIHPKKFALWIGLTSVVMLFAALTSAYIVRRSAGNWQDFALPSAFFYSTAAILASSVALHLSFKAFLAQKINIFKIFLITGFVLGILFVILQYQGWLQLHDIGIFVATNQSASFVYLITAFHVAHVLGGIAALLLAMIYGLQRRYQAVTPQRKLRLELIFTYWHFVDALWVYLLLFFLAQQ